MSLVNVTQELQSRVQDAMSDPYRFERYQRYAMGEVLRAWERHSPVASVFVETTHEALGMPQHTRRLGAAAQRPEISVAA